MRSAIVWDWNGTLLDDVDVCVKAMNRLLVARRLAPMTRERYHQIFTFPVQRYYEAMGFDFAHEYHDSYAAVVADAPLRPDAVSALERAAACGVPQLVLSALEERRLLRELETRGIRGYFAAVYGLGDLHAVSKAARGAELVAEWGGPGVDTLLAALHEAAVCS
ncbi:MAG: HAD family hydrolase [Spirochaetota bacterium]